MEDCDTVVILGLIFSAAAVRQPRFEVFDSP